MRACCKYDLTGVILASLLAAKGKFKQVGELDRD